MFTETTEQSCVFAVSLPHKTLMIYLLVLLINLLIVTLALSVFLLPRLMGQEDFLPDQQ